MTYLKNRTDNFLQIFLMGTSWIAVSINNITRASREMTSRKNINIFEFNGVNVAKHWHVAGEVFAISDCLVKESVLRPEIFQILSASQAKKHTQKKNTGQDKVEFFMQ